MAMADPLLPEAVGHTPPSRTTSLTPRQSSREAAQPDPRSRVPAPIPPAYVRQGSGLGGAVQVTQGEHRYRSGQLFGGDRRPLRGREALEARALGPQPGSCPRPHTSPSRGDPPIPQRKWPPRSTHTLPRCGNSAGIDGLTREAKRRSASSRIAVPIRGATTQGRSRSR